MSIKKQWLKMLILIAITSVLVNTLVLSFLINRNFVDFKKESYQNHLSQIIQSAKNALAEGDYSKRQLSIQLEAHLTDPITKIKLYDSKGNLLVAVGNELNMRSGMMRDKMMNRMMGLPREETDHVEVIDDYGSMIAQLNITRYSSIANSMETRSFIYALVINSLISIGLVFFLAIITGLYVSNKMSKDLINTALFAQNIDLGNENINNNEMSNVKEIRAIQQSLQTLQTKLKLKQKSRKKLIDELVHQTRTPLTILKTHIEGVNDGIIKMTSPEIKVCENQIENLTSIIENMSNMIDAQKDIETIKIEEVEIYHLLTKIVSSLKAQFDKKKIELLLLNTEKINIKTDKYILSQCIYNILTNAYKFTESGGLVSIAHELLNEQLLIVIEDNGIGIHEKDLALIFNAYFKGNHINNMEGEGLGLYIVKENIKKLNGTIDVESEANKGSRFIIKLPFNIIFDEINS